jgi:hypothetical protein
MPVFLNTWNTFLRSPRCIFLAVQNSINIHKKLPDVLLQRNDEIKHGGHNRTRDACSHERTNRLKREREREREREKENKYTKLR